MRTNIDRQFDFSGGIQTATSRFLRKGNEVADAINARFNKIIGSVVRRNGIVQEGDTIQSTKRGLGSHEAKFDTGAKVLVAINNSGDTATTVRSYDTSDGSFDALTLPNAIDPNTKMQFIDHIGETYAAGQSTTSTFDRMTLINIKSDLTVSESRNLYGAPKARFLGEYGGSLYAMNVELNGTVYKDRAYRSSPPTGVITFTQGVQVAASTSTFTVRVDSVRYLKAGMAIDVYRAGSSTKLHDWTIVSVDKPNNTITVDPTDLSFTNANVNTTTDVITIGADVPTGTPVQLDTAGTIPTGLAEATTYYVIRDSATTIKLATSLANALAGTAIDITAAGSGTFTVWIGVNDNDEIWLDGRYGELSVLWNTDYPTADKADFLRIPPGVDSNSEITGWGKSGNRLVFFTESSMHTWDNANLVTIFEDVGCVSHETIKNIGDWLIWLDAECRVHARNGASGQHEIISRFVKNEYLESVPSANLVNAAAGVLNNEYRLCLGDVGDYHLRMIYDFEGNTWARDKHERSMVSHFNSDMSGTMKMYFLDDTGRMFEDDTGNDDLGVTIPFEVEFGRSNLGTEQHKNYHGVYVFGQNCSGTQFQVDTDGKDEFPNVGQLEGDVTRIAFTDVHGRDANYKVAVNAKGDAPRIDGFVTYFNSEEDNFG